ncbi:MULTISPECIES: CU044_5270 family protein [Streptomyces]|uniref:CU044_5270 family protein n=2 Tax=Streptomyces TaxID=1883 RepID=A0ABV9IK74_9ACTN
MKKIQERAGRPDVMKLLADARPEALDPALLADAPRQRTDLARILAGGTEGQGRLRVVRPFWAGMVRPLGAAVALTAVAATVVVVSSADSQTPSGGAGTRSQASSGDPAVPGGRLELLAAAKKAETSPAEGTYWQTATRSDSVDVVGKEGALFAVNTTSKAEWSVGVRPGTQSLMVTGIDGATAPRTAADKARWQAAGSPASLQAPGGEGAGKGTLEIVIGSQGRPLVMETNSDEKIYSLGPRNVSYDDLRELPSKSDELSAYLKALYAEDSGAETASGQTAWMLRRAADLVTMPVKPAVRAAAYRVMADLPGVRVLARATDPLGREGVAVVAPGTVRTLLGSVEQRLVVDPSTGEMLCEQDILVEPSARAEEAGLKAGTTVNYQATTGMSWGEQQITVPANAQR